MPARRARVKLSSNGVERKSFANITATLSDKPEHRTLYLVPELNLKRFPREPRQIPSEERTAAAYAEVTENLLNTFSRPLSDRSPAPSSLRDSGSTIFNGSSELRSPSSNRPLHNHSLAGVMSGRQRSESTGMHMVQKLMHLWSPVADICPQEASKRCISKQGFGPNEQACTIILLI